MSYTPNPYDTTQPTSDRFVESAAAEFRALKALVSTLPSADTFEGDWSTLSGAIPAGHTVSHLGTIWLAVGPIANVVAEVPGVSALWVELRGMAISGGVFTGPIEVPAGAAGNQVPRASEVVPLMGGAAQLPSWDTAGRPASPGLYSYGFNTDLQKTEYWTGTRWQFDGWAALATVDLNTLASAIADVPAGMKQFRVVLPQWSHSSGSNQALRIRIGPAAGVATTGYVSGSFFDNGTATLAGPITGGVQLPVITGTVTTPVVVDVVRHIGNIWLVTMTTVRDNGVLSMAQGFVTLSGELEKIEIGVTGGVFDQGAADTGKAVIYGSF